MKMIVNLLLGILNLSALFTFTQAATFYEVVSEDWTTWKLLHQKNYDNLWVEKFRLKIYMENKAQISRHNALAHRGEKSYFLKMNNYGDLLHEEFKGRFNGYNYQQKLYRNDAITHITPAHVVLPEEVDWRKHGAVTDVKNQTTCGSCYAFSATGALEGQHYRKTGHLVSLSEQNLIDCSAPFGNEGCDGGLMDDAFRYVKSNGGIDTEKSYPYNGHVGACRFNARNIGATGKGFVDIATGNEEALKAAVATVGPISVGIDASHYNFQFYSHGIYDEEGCDPEDLDHGVLIVGYGTNEEGDYWIVKNSWGKKWGQEGFIKMARNKENQCGIASSASYPLV